MSEAVPIPLVDLTRQTELLRPDLQRALNRVLASGSFILGSEVVEFEKEFAAFCHARYGIGVASGTDALELALRALGVGPGDMVATVSFTFIATIDTILHVGAQPLFVDIDPGTYTMDPSDLETRLQRIGRNELKRVKAIIPVHLYGHPCDMDAIRLIAKRYRLAVVEDCAQAAGARWKGHPVGSLGDVGCFSFYPSKNLGCFGDGGMTVTNSSHLASRLRRLRVHGRQGRERQVELGRNSRLDEMQAAILRVKLRKLSSWVAKRQSLAQTYTRILSQFRMIQCPFVEPEASHAFYAYVIRLKWRSALQIELKRRSISTQVYYSIPDHFQPIHRRKYRKIRLAHTEKAAREVLALPIFPELRPAEQVRICREIARHLAASPR